MSGKGGNRFPPSFIHAIDDSKGYCVGATREDDSKGRLINHSKDDANLSMKVFVVNDAPRVVFLASKDISVGDEIQYDCGDKRKEVLRKNPWLK